MLRCLIKGEGWGGVARVGREVFSGRAAYATRSEYERGGQRVFEFDVATEVQGETIWRRAICHGDVAALAIDEVKKGTRVMIEGETESKGQRDRSGNTVQRFVTFVTRLIIGDSEATTEANTPSAPGVASEPTSTPEQDYQKFREMMKTSPPRFPVDLPETPRPEDLIDISPDEVRRLIASLL
jgi:Single-stranded DNA-binding protein